MKSIKVLGNCCFIFLAFAGLLISIAFVYYHFFVDEIVVGTNYIDNQIAVDIEDVIDSEELTTEEIDEYEDRYFLEVNYYSNSKNNGIALQELKLNYFTDYTLLSSTYKSSGMQYVGDLKQEDLKTVSTSSEEAQVMESQRFYYYDTTNGISWDGNRLRNQMNRASHYTIKIDNRAFDIQLDKYFEWTTYQRQWYTLWIWNKPIVHTTYYTYANVFADCMQAVRTNSKSYGDYYITVDLSRYFTIREFDVESGKYKSDDVTDIIKSYSVLKFHYDENGARNSTQSMFECIECNPSYDVVDKNIDTTYWQERIVYNLDCDDLDLRYSSVYEGYFVSINLDKKRLFANMPRAKVYLTINTLFEDKTIVGIDYNGFENFEIDTLTILGSNQVFHILDKGLYNSKLQTLKHSNGITFDNALTAINSNYQEVELS